MRYGIITGIGMLFLVLIQPTNTPAGPRDRDHAQHAQDAGACEEIPAQGLKIIIPFASGSATVKGREGRQKHKTEPRATAGTPSAAAPAPRQAHQESPAETETPPALLMGREDLQPAQGAQPETQRQAPRQPAPAETPRLVPPRATRDTPTEVPAPQQSHPPAAAPSPRPVAVPPVASLPAPVPHPPSAPEMPAPTEAEQLYHQALATYQRGNYEGAIGLFTHLLQQYPQAPHAAQSQLWIGNARYAQQRYEEAIVAFDAVIQHDPHTPYAPMARLRQAHAFAALQDFSGAKAVLRRVQKDYAGSAEAHEATQQLQQLGRSGAPRTVEKRR